MSLFLERFGLNSKRKVEDTSTADESREGTVIRCLGKDTIQDLRIVRHKEYYYTEAQWKNVVEKLNELELP